MKKNGPVLAASIASKSGSGYPEPFNTVVGNGRWKPLGDQFELTQFGINLETLNPGDQSALRHWHSLSDEFVYVLVGELSLVTDAEETPLRAGMCVGFKAGERNGHHLINRGSAQAQVLVIGSRVPGDTAFYPDDDLVWLPTEDGRVPVHKDGQAYS